MNAINFKQNQNLRKLVLAALFVALDIVVTRFFSIQASETLRFGFQTTVYTLGGFFLGPIYAAGAFLCGDILGFAINSAGMVFNPGFSISAILSGLFFGYLLHNKPVSIWRTVVVFATHIVLINLIFRTLLLSFSYSLPLFPLFLSRLITVPINDIPSAAIACVLLRILPDKVKGFTSASAVLEKAS